MVIDYYSSCRRCCMNLIGDSLVECCFLVSCFFYSTRLRFASMDHSIEDGTAQATFDLLIGPATRLQIVVDSRLFVFS